MLAVGFDDYGPPDVVTLREVEAPSPADGEVLIAVEAASVNSWDWERVRGRPYMARMGEGLRRPKNGMLGGDVAGRVEAVGGAVSRFRPGDEVLGDMSGCGWGAFAEYVCATEDALVPKPAGLAFDEAAAIPQAGTLALQAVRDEGGVEAGRSVLINGAGGGAGTFAIQIAKHYGAEVTAVDSTEKFETMRSIGADHVIDYVQEDFARSGTQYDLIVDFWATRSLRESRKALAESGTYVVVGGSTPHIMQFMLLGPVVSLIGHRKARMLIYKANRNLQYLAELAEAGKIMPIIDRRYALSEVPEALGYIEAGHSRGKLVITV